MKDGRSQGFSRQRWIWRYGMFGHIKRTTVLIYFFATGLETTFC